MRIPLFIGILIASIAICLQALFIVDEREKALVLQFGEVRSVHEEPGLFLKVPFIQEIIRYDDRILPLATEPFEVNPSDDRRLVVDAFARWRISDPVRFRRAVGTAGERGGESRLDKILRTQLRGVLGLVSSGTVLSNDRVELMGRIRDNSRTEASSLGIEVIDVRIKRADLPRQNLDATFERMRAEREREAADEIARGNEAAQRVRAQADRKSLVIVSEARKNAEIIRGQADAERNSIFAEAFGRDPEFFAFYRSLTAYEKSLSSENSTLVISPDSEFFEYLKSNRLAP